MTEFIIPEHPLLSEDERVELQEVFARFSAAIESPDEDSFNQFFAEEQEFFDNASQMQNMIFMLTMQQLGLVTEEEAAAALSGADLDEVIYDEEDYEFVNLDDEDDLDDEESAEFEVLADEYLAEDEYPSER